MGIQLGMDYFTWSNIQEWIPPHINYSCGTLNKISKPMGIGFGIDYVTWRNIPQWIPLHIKCSPGTQENFPIL